MIHKKIKCKMRKRMILVLAFIFFQHFDKLSIFAIFRKNKSPIYRENKKSDNIGKKRKSNISIFAILAKIWRYQTLPIRALTTTGRVDFRLLQAESSIDYYMPSRV